MKNNDSSEIEEVTSKNKSGDIINSFCVGRITRIAFKMINLQITDREVDFWLIKMYVGIQAILMNSQYIYSSLIIQNNFAAIIIKQKYISLLSPHVITRHFALIKDRKFGT